MDPLMLVDSHHHACGWLNTLWGLRQQCYVSKTFFHIIILINKYLFNFLYQFFKIYFSCFKITDKDFVFKFP